MKSVITSTLLLLLLPLVSSHFTLDFPKVRGFDEDKLGTFPCGTFDTVGSRTPWPITGGPIQLTMEHDRSMVQVLLAVGDDPGDHFNIVLVPTIQEQGIGKFCLGNVPVPASLGIKNGTTATLQVVTNGDPDGGLYNCADIIFLTSAEPGACTNGTGVNAIKYTGTKANANGTDESGVLSALPSSASGSSATGASATGTSATKSPSGTSTAPAATSSHSAAATVLEMGGWGFLGILGAAMALL